MSEPLKRPVLPSDLPPTPFYFYDEATLRDLSESFAASFAKNPKIHLHFAMKSNSNPAILKMLQSFGHGADTVSGEEIRLALECGFDADNMVYSGVGKSEEELRFAIEREIGMIIVESREEFEELCVLAKDSPKKVHVGFRFNPNLSVNTHPHIATGLWEHKFGMAGEEIVAMLALPRPANVVLEGLSLHLGSQIMEDKIFYDAVTEVVKLGRELLKKGIAFRILNVGGGLGVDYQQPYQKPAFAAYGKFLQWSLQQWQELNPNLDCQVFSECGRALVSQAGYLVTKVIRVKRNPKKNFAIVDASMTELIRPALYSAYHGIEKIYASASEDRETYDVVGPVCESGDFLGMKRDLAKLQKGDLLWVSCAGAYGYVLSTHYNMRPLPAEYLLGKGGQLRMLRAPLKIWKFSEPNPA